jgi:creatinine amidohydrolase/Fe(II)-dependent formamide hydrolase-like protein
MVVLEELTSGELEQLLERGSTTVVIPFGSVEHQGHQLPLGSDALLADVVGAAVADRVDAVLEQRFGELVLPSRLAVGWGYGTAKYVPFFNATITTARPV